MDKGLMLWYVFIIFLAGAYDIFLETDCEPYTSGEIYAGQCLLDYIPLIMAVITAAILLPWVKKDENA